MSPQASAQQIVRVAVDKETIDVLLGGETVHFPLNDENTRIIELELIDEENDDGIERGVE